MQILERHSFEKVSFGGKLKSFAVKDLRVRMCRKSTFRMHPPGGYQLSMEEIIKGNLGLDDTGVLILF